MISVIIPCFNGDKFLEETLKSVVNQTYQDIEIIVIDDGSTDRTKEIVHSFSFPITYQFQSNRGISAARNAGTALAKGEFIQYLDQDDLLTPKALEIRLKALMDTGADVAYSHWQKIKKNKKGFFEPAEIVSRTLEEVNPDREIALFSGFWAPLAAILYRRSLVDKIGGWKERFPVIQDVIFIIDAALNQARFVHVPFLGAQYREHSTSFSRASSIEFARDCFHSATDMEDWWLGHGGLTQERKKALVGVYGYVVTTSFGRDRDLFEAACQALKKQHHFETYPWKPKVLVILCRMVGYPMAEFPVSLYRKIRKPFLSH